MGSRDTQDLIASTALELFNEHGTSAVSTNRIADACGISRGNLHYHFRTKEEIIQLIFRRIVEEMDESWYRDHEQPTMEHMYEMFSRYMDLLWRYRFFYRELVPLTQRDSQLKRLYQKNLEKRIKEIEWFFERLVEEGLLIRPPEPVSLASLVRVSWFVSDYWLYFMNVHDKPANQVNIREGYTLITHIFEPYFSPKAREEQRRVLNGESGDGRIQRRKMASQKVT